MVQTRQSDLAALPWSPGPTAGVLVGGVGVLSHRAGVAGLTRWYLPSGRLPAPAGPAERRPGSGTEVAGLLPGRAQRGAGPRGKPMSGPGGWGLSAALHPSPPSPPLHPQEGRLVEKESSEWRSQGQPTVLLTLAHIFHHFAPLLVRGRQGERPRLWAGVLRCVRSSRITWRGPRDQSSQTSRMSWGSGGQGGGDASS